MNSKSIYFQKASGYGMPIRRENKILKLIGEVAEKKILDVGCASGYFGKKLEKKGAKVTGIDSSAQAIYLAKKFITNALVVDLNEIKIPLKSNSFDMILASEVLEHLINPLGTLKELYRILKPKGAYIVTTPNFMYWGNRIQFLKGRFRYEKDGMFDKSHIHFYTYSSLIDDLKNSKFKIKNENHIYTGSKILVPMKRHFPALFAYQFVIKCIK